MAFSTYKTIESVITTYQVRYTEETFIEEIPLEIPDFFRQDLQIVMQDGAVDSSEFAICENLIYPVLKQVWKGYRDLFILWSHHSLNYDKELYGFPEYILASRSPLGKVVFAQPYLLLVEAKQDDFEQAWGQCIAEMIAAQKLNADRALTVYGITSNGTWWQFGQLQNQLFRRNITYYSIQELDRLFAAVNFVFQQCAAQIRSSPPEAVPDREASDPPELG